MKAPKILGHPIWIGNKKRRRAKKALGWRWRHYMWAAKLKPGDLVNDCSSFNVRIVSAYVHYGRTGYGWFDLENDKGGMCSLESCGVGPALSYEEIIRQHREWVEELKSDEDYQRNWLNSRVKKDGREYWVSTVDPEYGALNLRPEALTIHPDGTREVNYEWVDQKLLEKLESEGPSR